MGTEHSMGHRLHLFILLPGLGMIQYNKRRELLLFAVLSMLPIQKLKAICDDFYIVYDKVDSDHLRQVIEAYWVDLFAKIKAEDDQLNPTVVMLPVRIALPTRKKS